MRPQAGQGTLRCPRNASGAPKRGFGATAERHCDICPFAIGSAVPNPSSRPACSSQHGREEGDRLNKAIKCALTGLDGQTIEVEVDVAPGLPHFGVVGLPDAAVPTWTLPEAIVLRRNLWKSTRAGSISHPRPGGWQYSWPNRTPRSSFRASSTSMYCPV